MRQLRCNALYAALDLLPVRPKGELYGLMAIAQVSSNCKATMLQNAVPLLLAAFSLQKTNVCVPHRLKPFSH